MSDIPTDPAPQSGIDVGALAHAIAGIAAVVLGGLMYTRPWAQSVFTILILSQPSAPCTSPGSIRLG